MYWLCLRWALAKWELEWSVLATKNSTWSAMWWAMYLFWFGLLHLLQTNDHRQLTTTNHVVPLKAFRDRDPFHIFVWTNQKREREKSVIKNKRSFDLYHFMRVKNQFRRGPGERIHVACHIAQWMPCGFDIRRVGILTRFSIASNYQTHTRALTDIDLWIAEIPVYMGSDQFAGRNCTNTLSAFIHILYLIKYNFEQFHIYSVCTWNKCDTAKCKRRYPPHKVKSTRMKRIFLSHSLLFDVSPMHLFRLRNVIFHILLFRFVSWNNIGN